MSSAAALPGQRPLRSRRSTATARFGSSRRESHDASGFYARFVPPELSTETTVVRPKKTDVIYNGDARRMKELESNSVALVVTSPPYFAGKEYEESLGQDGVPATYFEFLALLKEVFAECKRVLEPGGRIAVNVANLGRRPYRSLAGDVAEILQELGLLMRGEIVWWKGRAAGGSCAWGTFQRPANPVLRDVTERIVVASKGRFDRALSPKERHVLGLPSTTTISRDEFLEATTDLWEIPSESATRVGHPAPFPVELPQRLIELYTYEEETVLDPFMGSGTTAVAAVRTGRHYVGYDTEASYVRKARARIASEIATSEHHDRRNGSSASTLRVKVPAADVSTEGDELERAVREGRQAKELAAILLESSGFGEIRRDVKFSGRGAEVSFVARDRRGGDWMFDVSGALTSNRGGLRRTETLWKVLGKAAVLHASGIGMRLVLITTDAPRRGSAGRLALDSLTGAERPIWDVVELLDPSGAERLGNYALGGHPTH